MRKHVAWVLLVPTLAGCGDALMPDSASDARVAAQMDSLVYHLTRVPGGYDARAMLGVTNAGGRALYFARCTPGDSTPGYQLRRSGPDSTAPSVVWPIRACVGGVPVGHMAPGTTLTIPVWLGSADSPQADPPITPEQRVGTFRASVVLCRRQAEHCPPADRVRAETEAFRLTY